MAEVDAITVDAALTELRRRLGTAGDRLLHLIDLITFTEQQVARLRPKNHAASFVLEVLDLYDRLLSEPFDPAGLNPRLLKKASTTLGDLEATHNDPGGLNDRSIQTRERLGILAACQFTLVGSFEDAVRVLDLARADVPKEPGTLEDRPTWLRGLLKIRYPHQIPWADGIIEYISSWWNPADRHCHYPAVFRISAFSNSRDHHGFIRRLSLEIRAFSNERDQFSFEFVVDSEADRYLKPVLTAGRAVLNTLTPDAALRSFRGGYRVARTGAAHAGRSAGLAMGSLFISEAQHFTDQRNRCVVNPGTVLTGAISETGRIEEVAPDTLTAKVESVFFSPARVLVLPLGQSSEASRILGRLENDHPRRKLVVLGKESLTDVFSDRRIVSIRERGRISHAAVQFWRRKWAVSAALTTFIFMTALVIWRILAMDAHPVALDISEAGVRLLNQSERVIWRKEVSRQTAMLHTQPGNAPLARRMALADVNADGYMDAFWIESPDAQELEAMMFNSLDGRSMTPLWDPFPLKIPLNYPFDVSIYSNQMTLVDMEVAELTGDDLPELVLSLAHRSYYPAVVTIMDPRTGQIAPGYHHAGMISDILVADLDNSFPPEILAVGTNNAFDSAVLTVLDVDRLAGRGPSFGQYRSSKPAEANERAYLKFPLTPLARYTGLPYAHALRIDIISDPELVRVYTRDLRDVTMSNPGPTGLRWDLDYRLRPIAVGTDDPFDHAWERALEEGVVDAPLDNDFKINLMGQIEMWTANGWEPVPLSESANVPTALLNVVD